MGPISPWYPGVRICDLQTIRANNPLADLTPGAHCFDHRCRQCRHLNTLIRLFSSVRDPTERIFCFKTFSEILRQNSSSLSRKRWEWLMIEKCVWRDEKQFWIWSVWSQSDVECQLYKWSSVKIKILLWWLYFSRGPVKTFIYSQKSKFSFENFTQHAWIN